MLYMLLKYIWEPVRIQLILIDFKGLLKIILPPGWKPGEGDKGGVCPIAHHVQVPGRGGGRWLLGLVQGHQGPRTLTPTFYYLKYM